jgi:hypothetical protein
MEESGKYVIFYTVLLEKLTHRQAILFGVLNGMAIKEGYCYASNKTLAKIMNCSVDSIQRDLNIMAKSNYIKREIIRNENGEVVNRKIYLLYSASPLTAGMRIPSPQNCEEGSPQNCDINKDKIDINKIILKSGLKNEYIEPLKLWLSYKKEMKQSYKEVGLSTLINKIMKDYPSSEDFATAVNFSISNNYSGLTEKRNIKETKTFNYGKLK